MRSWVRRLACISATLAIGGSSAIMAQDVGAVTSGNWNNGSTWTNGAPPGSSNNVYIGSTYPSAAAATATVTLTEAQSANNLYLGNGSGTNGILDLAGNSLTITGSLVIGQSSGVATLNEGGGSFTAANASVENGNLLTFGTRDVVSSLQLSGGSNATTTAAGNVTGGVQVYSGSTLNLGANMNIGSGIIDNRDSSSILNAQGHTLTAGILYAGWFDSSAVSVTNLGQVTLTNLYVGNGTVGSDLTLHGGDVINSLIDLTNGSVLTVQQMGGVGLTLNGTSPGSLTIDPSSMDLIFTSTALDNWDFRWRDPSSTSNWISTIDTMIHDGQIMLTLLPDQSYQVADSGGYTYIYGIGGASVPQPSSLALFCMGSLGVIVAARWRRKGR